MTHTSRDIKLLIIMAVIVCGFTGFLLIDPYDKELQYYRDQGYILAEKRFDSFVTAVDAVEAILVRSTTKQELRDFAKKGLLEMGHCLVYHDDVNRIIFIGRYCTYTEMLNLRISGKFLIYEWKSRR